MLDDYFLRAILAGLGIALMAGPLGCFIVWQRLAYFGDTLSHSALLGIAFALLLQSNTMLGVFIIAIIVALALFFFQRRENLGSDSLLGILSHGTLALGLILIDLMPWVRVDLMGYLFGDILAVSKQDLAIVWAGVMIVILLTIFLWRRLVALTVNRDLAQAENMHPDIARFALMMILAIIIAVAMNIVGILLITAMLIIPAASARRFSSSPEQMVLISALLGIIGTMSGLFGSVQFDTRSGASIVTGLFVVFLITRFIPLLKKGTKNG